MTSLSSAARCSSSKFERLLAFQSNSARDLIGEAIESGELSRAEAFAGLAAALKDSGRRKLHAEALRALGDLAGEELANPARAAIQERLSLEYEDSKIIDEGVGSLLKIKGGVEALRELLGRENLGYDEWRAYASRITTLRPACHALLAPLLAHYPGIIMDDDRKIMRALLEGGEEALLALVLELGNTRHQALRVCCAHLAAKQGAKGSSLLLERAEKGSPAERAAALDTLGMMHRSPFAVEALTGLVEERLSLLQKSSAASAPAAGSPSLWRRVSHRLAGKSKKPKAEASFSPEQGQALREALHALARASLPKRDYLFDLFPPSTRSQEVNLIFRERGLETCLRVLEALEGHNRETGDWVSAIKGDIREIWTNVLLGEDGIDGSKILLTYFRTKSPAIRAMVVDAASRALGKIDIAADRARDCAGADLEHYEMVGAFLKEQLPELMFSPVPSPTRALLLARLALSWHFDTKRSDVAKFASEVFDGDKEEWLSLESLRVLRRFSPYHEYEKRIKLLLEPNSGYHSRVVTDALASLARREDDSPSPELIAKITRLSEEDNSEAVRDSAISALKIIDPSLSFLR